MESLKTMTFETHAKCPSCMIGKATLEDTFSSSVKSIEGYIHVIVFVDVATGYRWIYGMKTKDDGLVVIKVLRTLHSDIADLRTKHKLLVLMQGNASEYKSEEMMQFLESKGI